jgi:MoaA/NifB/PqqE/SkfB family radical SAM enzyme
MSSEANPTTADISFNRPGEVRWECNLRCNLSCEHCYIDATPDAPLPAVKKSNAFDLVDKVENIGPFVFQIEGGETMMREDIVEVIDYATTKPMKVVLNSNGTLLTDEKWRALDDAGLHQLNISIDGPQEIHDDFRGREGLYEETLDNIRRIRNLDIDIDVRINTVINARNWSDFPRMVDDIETLPIVQWDLIRYHPMGRGDESLCLEPEQLQEVIRAVERLREETDANPGLDQCFPMYNKANRSDGVVVSESMEAVAGGSILTISPTGEVLPGPHLRSVSFGNILEDSAEEILERKAGFVGDFAVPETCRSCEEYGVSCKGGGREVALLRRGEHAAMDPGCWKVDQEKFE